MKLLFECFACVFACILTSSKITRFGSWKAGPSFQGGFCHRGAGAHEASPLRARRGSVGRLVGWVGLFGPGYALNFNIYEKNLIEIIKTYLILCIIL
jgi:hypothetical protein